MTFFYDAKTGNREEIPEEKISAQLYHEARDAGVTVPQLINRMFPDADRKFGSAFQQICASNGLQLTAQGDVFGSGSGSVMLNDIFEGKAGPVAAANVGRKSDPFGNQSRTLFPAFVIQAVEDLIQPDRTTDYANVVAMAAMTVPIVGSTFVQPILSYGNAGGANTGTFGAQEGRVVQGANVPTVLFLTTSEKWRKIPTYGISVEMTDDAVKNTTLDLFSLTIGRFMQIEKDKRAYRYLTNLFSGDVDLNIGSVSAVTSTSLDPAATGGVLTHRAWLKFLARKRRYRSITHVICDLDTYMKVEGRTGRPGSNNYDPTLARIDPQLRPGNPTFGGDVQWVIVDPATEGGPVPANTIWALDASQAFMMLKNTEADYTATESFVLKRSKAAVWHWSEEVARLYGDAELSAFDILTIL